MHRKVKEEKEPFQKDSDDCGQDGEGGDGGEPCPRNPAAGFETSCDVDGGSGSEPDLHFLARHLQLQATSKNLLRHLEHKKIFAFIKWSRLFFLNCTFNMASS